uniref:7TM_GPCR_Srx domain-containing protein n=1 Tax=Strongyloides venezuelensis TaxID=75913 RepID=A0A0K0ETW7_STRVS
LFVFIFHIINILFAYIIINFFLYKFKFSNIFCTIKYIPFVTDFLSFLSLVIKFNRLKNLDIILQ